MDKDKMTAHADEPPPRDDDVAGLQENLGTAVEAAQSEQPPVDAKETVETDASPGVESLPVSELTSLAEKRARLVTAGLATAVILSVIAVLVAGVFRLTSTWFLGSPEQHSANGPTPLLWSQMVSEKVQAQPLGVSKDIAVQVGLKEAAAPLDESASEAAKTNDKQQVK